MFHDPLGSGFGLWPPRNDDASIPCYTSPMPDGANISITLDPETAKRLAELAAQEGGSPEALAAELVADYVREADDHAERVRDGYPPLTISDEDLRASIEEQRRQIAAGTAVLHSHEEVMASARARLNKALEAKS